MSVSIVVARSRNHVIGVNGKIPWHIPEDFAHFKALTTGHPIIMGRKTFESIGAPLPGRTSIVITRQADFAHPGVEVARSFNEAITIAQAIDDEVFIIGGQQIYEQAFNSADELIVSEIPGEFDGDAFFEIPAGWSEIAHEDKGTFSLVRYRRN